MIDLAARLVNACNGTDEVPWANGACVREIVGVQVVNEPAVDSAFTVPD